MRWNQAHIFTLKEAPSDAEIPSHKWLVRGGFIKKLAPGIYSYSHLALRAIRKFERIIREELNQRGCTEILMPIVQPQSLWEETGRWSEMGDGLLKFKNRNGHGFCLGATHEEAITDYVRYDIKSYRDLPRNIYQIQTKYRDEIRPRFGLMRGREFIMKDAYSFDLNKENAEQTYHSMYEAYKCIFSRLGLNFRIVQADSGNIGGSLTHEFQVLAEAGEDALLVSSESDYAANIEVCPAIDPDSHLSQETTVETRAITLLPLEKFATPGQKTIADLAKFTGVAEKNLVKTLYFSANEGFDPLDKSLKPFAVLLRGSDEVNPVKIKNLLGLSNPPLFLTDDEVKQVTGAWPGSCGPVGLKIPVYLDNGVKDLKNYIVGANEDGFHLKNVNHDRDYKVTKFADLRMARVGDRSPDGKGFLQAFRGIEVGQVFYLGTKYSKKMGANYLAQDGTSKPIEMGCYGIGVSRTIQAAIEQCHDKDGIVWPKAIAPFDVHICVLDVQDEKVKTVAIQLHDQLQAAGVEVLLDDRDERPGVKFKDADLLGMPFRINVGKRGLDEGGAGAEGVVELIERKTKAMEKLPPSSILGKFKK